MIVHVECTDGEEVTAFDAVVIGGTVIHENAHKFFLTDLEGFGRGKCIKAYKQGHGAQAVQMRRLEGDTLSPTPEIQA